jgi:hypothetical protein
VYRADILELVSQFGFYQCFSHGWPEVMGSGETTEVWRPSYLIRAGPCCPWDSSQVMLTLITW